MRFIPASGLAARMEKVAEHSVSKKEETRSRCTRVRTCGQHGNGHDTRGSNLPCPAGAPADINSHVPSRGHCLSASFLFFSVTSEAFLHPHLPRRVGIKWTDSKAAQS